jgi:hypothetical protein
VGEKLGVVLAAQWFRGGGGGGKRMMGGVEFFGGKSCIFVAGPVTAFH